MKMMVQRQIKDLPKDAQDSIMNALDKNPDFFKNIIDEISAKVSAGTPQVNAIQQVMMSHRQELQKIMGQ